MNLIKKSEDCDITIMTEDGAEIARIHITPDKAEHGVQIVAVCRGVEKRFSVLHYAEHWIERMCREETPS